jgi:hypothetical protein
MTTVPDDEDTRMVTPARLEREGAQVLAGLAKKYRAPAVVLAALDRSGPVVGAGAATARLQAIFWSSRTGRKDFDYSIEAGRDRDAALSSAASALHMAVRQAWSDKRRKPKTSITVRMPVASQTQWRRDVALLEGISGLEVEIKRLNESVAEAELLFAGSRARLFEALSRRGFIGNRNSKQGER